MKAGWLVLAVLLPCAVANAALAPASVQAEFKRWTVQLEMVLQAQPKSSDLRKNLRLWFSDQGKSMSKVKEPLLSASLPSKLWGSAAFLTDSANQSVGALSAVEYRALLDFSDRVLDFCNAGYRPRQSVCTDEHYWELKAKNALFKAQLLDSDFEAVLGSVVVLAAESFRPLQGGFATSDPAEIAGDRCNGWFRIWANFLTPDFNNYPGRLREPAFVEAYLAQAAETIRICEQAKANPTVSLASISYLGVVAIDAAKPVSAEALRLARPIAERAYAMLLGDTSAVPNTTPRADYQLWLLLLAQSLGDRAQAQAWASAIPKSLSEVNENTGHDFVCRYFTAQTRRVPDSWRTAIRSFPEDYRSMRAACPLLDAE